MTVTPPRALPRLAHLPDRPAARQPDPVTEAPPIELRAICVYCGSSPGVDPAFAEAAVEMGRELAARGIRLVYGGGAVGLMGIVADAVLDAGGSVTGVIPHFLHEREIQHRGVPDLRVVGSMHERKAIMAEEANAFVALPGGIGTFEELFEVLTWTQLGLHDKPVALLEVAGFWDPLLALLDRAVAEHFLKPDAAAALQRGATPSEVIDGFAAFRPPSLDKWSELGHTGDTRTDLV